MAARRPGEARSSAAQLSIFLRHSSSFPHDPWIFLHNPSSFRRNASSFLHDPSNFLHNLSGGLLEWPLVEKAGAGEVDENSGQHRCDRSEHWTASCRNKNCDPACDRKKDWHGIEPHVKGPAVLLPSAMQPHQAYRLGHKLDEAAH